MISGTCTVGIHCGTMADGNRITRTSTCFALPGKVPILKGKLFKCRVTRTTRSCCRELQRSATTVNTWWMESWSGCWRAVGSRCIQSERTHRVLLDMVNRLVRNLKNRPVRNLEKFTTKDDASRNCENHLRGRCIRVTDHCRRNKLKRYPTDFIIRTHICPT